MNEAKCRAWCNWDGDSAPDLCCLPKNHKGQHDPGVFCKKCFKYFIDKHLCRVVDQMAAKKEKTNE